MVDRPRVPGTAGYAENAAELIPRYDDQSFTHKHRAVLHLLPRAPTTVLELGAGTGADAAWWAQQGHTVLAVEPTAAFRSAGQALHADAAIEWLDDHLPELSRVRQRGQCFGVLMLTAVWMHLDEAERATAMAHLATLMARDGITVMALRHGPVPAGRRMFEVSGAETVSLAQGHGLRCVLQLETESTQDWNRAAGVTWTRLAFVHAA